MQTTTIPALPCESLDRALEFWQAMGFTIGYRQRAPNAYAVIRAPEYELHLFGLKQLRPQDNFSTCLVIVPEVEQLHQAFSDRMRESLGKVPSKGFPRISRMRPSQSRFTLTDVAGNSVIFIKRGGEDMEASAPDEQPGQTPLQRAITLAARLRDFKHDDAAAAKALDIALAREPDQASPSYARAIADRLELAIALDDDERAQALRAELDRLEQR
jgi:hypothetical protein